MPSSGIPREYAELARRLRAAEDRLYPLAMVDAERYQRALQLVGALARRLAGAGDYADLAAAEREMRGWLDEVGVPLHGLDVQLVIEAAMSQRFRELLTSSREQAVEHARAAGLEWAVIEEPDDAAWRGGSARWVEVHLPSGSVMVRSVVAEPVITYRLEVTGEAVRVEEFTSREAWLAAIDQARRALASES
ncbi:hypothetical protein [Nonomuraea lactucae]|uniref:hypothetical protein n=1 Tax=Nonomuraea lactucae TaxID=2249762 RepID=UPI000DE3865E|nr:hypothetical protein [Nonomuraea lactucae]